jgi:hypothetical protein
MTTAATGRSHLPVVHAATINETRSFLCGRSQDCEIALRVDDAERRNRDGARDLLRLSDGSRNIQRPQRLKNLMVIAFYPYRAYKNVTRTLSCTAVSGAATGCLEEAASAIGKAIGESLDAQFSAPRSCH